MLDQNTQTEAAPAGKTEAVSAADLVGDYQATRLQVVVLKVRGSPRVHCCSCVLVCSCARVLVCCGLAVM